MGREATASQSSGLREFLNSPAGKGLAIGAAVLMLVAAGYFIWQSMGPSEAGALSRDRLYIDAKTMKSFRHEMKPGEQLPIDAPSGGKTGHLAELCFWTKDGKVKEEPYPVLMNTNVGKPEPTFCPDCGRLVKFNNPAPTGKPPPTQAEYMARRGEQRP